MTTKANRAARMRELLVVTRDLGREGTLARAGAVVAEAIRRIPLEEEELEPLSNDTPRGEVNARWSSRELVEAGWMAKDPKGTSWTITPAGEAALEQYGNIQEFAIESRRRSNEWRSTIKGVRAEQLSSVILPQNEDQIRVLDAAQLFVERGLKQGSSVFAPSRSVWAEGPVAELVANFIGVEPTAGSFVESVKVQLADVSDDARLLMAELVTWQFLPISHRVLGERKKSERVNFILELMDEPVPVPIEVRRAFAGGAFNPGVRMSNGIPEAIHIMIRLLESWLALSLDEKEAALENPLLWRGLVQSADGQNFPSQRNALLYLVHPGHYGPLVSEDHKRRIRKSFMAEIDGPTDDIEEDIYNITIALQQKESSPAQYYQDPLKSMWFEEAAPAPAPLIAGEVEDREAETPVVAFGGELRHANAELSQSLNVSADWLTETISLLSNQKQMVFYGPPGTGKTYFAREIGKHVGGNENVDVVQFHPSYSYEDFFEGFRPTLASDGTMAFALRPGPLRRIADRAAANPEYPYVLIIDEINRGNLSKIFGELYYLLEYRDDEISLLYGEVDEKTGTARKFALPANLFIIGTMNTSDRSIALLDAAMRRRFAFRELHPEKEPVQGVISTWAAKSPDENGFFSGLAPLLQELNKRITDDAFKVGPSYLLKASDEAALDRIWKSQILPLLAELHFGEDVDLERRYGLASLRRSLGGVLLRDDEPDVL